MRDASDSGTREGFTCPVCGRFVVTAVVGLYSTPTSGSPERFCDPACRQAPTAAAEPVSLSTRPAKPRVAATAASPTQRRPSELPLLEWACLSQRRGRRAWMAWNQSSSRLTSVSLAADA
jgi:hypothetical protein